MVTSKYRVIGLMSGTSLDGLDLAFCEFERSGNLWWYCIHRAETIAYTASWKERLSSLENASALDFVATDIEYGHLLGRMTQEFIIRQGISPDFIASHGHTIFHQPGKRITSQIGRGSAIAAETHLPVVCDFRSLDVALGGQGAPLVPIGDHILFNDFDYCLNIGGFANISFQVEDNRIAYDIGPANIVLNKLANAAGFDYDRDGEMGQRGDVNAELLAKLNALPYYSMTPPKSLGKEWVLEQMFPVIQKANLSTNDLLATVCEHVALQIAYAAPGSYDKKILVTGGGALNKFLISRIRMHAGPEIIIPDLNTINYKEALIFAFLGVLRWRNEVNCLRSVTGAERDSIGGAIY